MIFGVIVTAPVAVLSWLSALQEMQTRIIFNKALSMRLNISQMITGREVMEFKVCVYLSDVLSLLMT
jgi:hypothetical protein